MKDKLFRFAFHLLQNVQEAEDAVQDVMAGIWARRDQWGEWKSIEAYCMTATRKIIALTGCANGVFGRWERKGRDKSAVWIGTHTRR